MSQAPQSFNINCQPGIYRDWTGNSSMGYTDGQYTRFFEGRAKKIGGWELLTSLSSLTQNETPYLAVPTSTVDWGNLTIGKIRAVKTFPADGRFFVVVCADIIGAIDGSTNTTPTDYMVPSGVFIGSSDDNFAMPFTLYPVRFEKYFLFNNDGTVNLSATTGFLPGQYNWSISIYGVTSGGENAGFTINNPTGGGGNLSSLALAVHPADTLQDKNSPNNSYVYFGLLSDLLNTSDSRNYAIDPLDTSKPLYSPVLFPMTQYPVSGTTSPDITNVFQMPSAVDNRAIYCTSEVIVSGGVSSVGPFLVAYGNNGLVRNCAANNPSVWYNPSNQYYNYNPLTANDNNLDNYKAFACATVRGGSGLSALLWSTNALWLMQFTGGQGFFSYSNISNSISIISANTVVEASGIYYWVGEDRFYAYSGAIQPLPNQQNYTWFFKNLNYTQRTKMFAFKVPHYNELWWVFPKGNSEECNHAIVYNLTEQFWYDTPWDRSAGYYEQAFYLPLLAGGEVAQSVQDNRGNLSSANAQGFWKHEIGTCEVRGKIRSPYNAFVTTSDIGLLNGGPAAGKGNFQGSSSLTYLERIFPDLIGVGQQYISVTTRQYPQDSGKIVVNQITYDPNTPSYQNLFIGVGQQGRLMYITFGCAEVDSDFYLGKPVMIVREGDQQ